MKVLESEKLNFNHFKLNVKYATNIVDDYYYHSIIYDDKGFNIKDDRLGVAISHGCIRLATSSAKWIYDNIPEGTPIIINWYI